MVSDLKFVNFLRIKQSMYQAVYFCFCVLSEAFLFRHTKWLAILNIGFLIIQNLFTLQREVAVAVETLFAL